ncbi:MAG: branched-chain amino acid aminotransferase [Clostridiaceae bacterium]|jgi:branched-chain amino acid aminotransferase|nr:branched-chain amino acid aminotransferase [Clostridiaceae bacterium]
MEIRVELTKNPKSKPNPDKLGFGNHFSDHMFIMDYTEGKGWHDARIVPYGPISYEPSIMVFHYGQSIFEGLKAYRTENGQVVLFRPDENMKRLNASCDRLCIPGIDEEFAIKALKQLINIDIDWVPENEGTSLYIRPFIIATDPFLGVRPSFTYQFIIITGPVGAYYKEGLNPVKIYVETDFVRAVIGGLGQAKASANYAASLKAQEVAKEKGYSQVLWLDGIEKKYIEEVGTMNVFFVIGDEVVTPVLNGSILPGITRKSCIDLLRHWGLKVSERKISMEEIFEANETGKLKEAFGTGTAAVISPIGELIWNDKKLILSNGKIGELSQKLYDNLTAIQYTKIPDPFNWVIKV